MQFYSRSISLLILVLFWCETLAGHCLAAAEPVVHDPVMIQAGERYYLFCTGSGIDVWSSTDRNDWQREKPVFDEAPAWVKESLPDFRNHIWAPDIFERDGTYYLYYSVSAFGRNNSAIGVATNQTLDAADPKFKWVDHGMVVQSVPGRDMWNAIDAAVFIDEDQKPWMVFGSHWGGIKLCLLQDDLLHLAKPEQWVTVAARHRYWKLDERDAGDSANPELSYDEIYDPKITELNRLSESGAIEAPFLFRKGNYYYLFVSWDRCCRGVNSTYKVMVGRSKEITGPYLDKEGEPMVYGGGSLVVEGVGESDRWAALGHNAVYTFDGNDYLVCHAYDMQDRGRPKLFIRPIEWDKYGWPHVDADDSDEVIAAATRREGGNPFDWEIKLGPEDKPAVADPPVGYNQRREDIPPGKLEMIEYDSKTVGTRRKMLVYTPPNLSSERKYPVLYLLHGIGGDETEWQRFCAPEVILDNLIADQHAEPMIVVMPNGRAQKNDRAEGNVFQHGPAFARFEQDLLEDVIPAIEARYPVLGNRDHRALAGLSMGGGQTLNFGLAHPDQFAWLGAFSAAPNTKTDEELLSNYQAASPQFKLIWLACGNQDGLIRISQRVHALLGSQGITHVWHVDEHGHDPTEWSKNLYHFVSRVFHQP